jgi:hypothetical protein
MMWLNDHAQVMGRSWLGSNVHISMPCCEAQLLRWLLSCAAGALAGCYESMRFKSKTKAPKLAALHMMGLGGSQQQLDAALQAGAGLASGGFMTRYGILLLC